MDILAAAQLLLQDQDVAFTFWVSGVPEGVLQVSSFVVEEVIFGLPRVEVMLVANFGHIKLEDLIDNAASLTIHHRYLPQLRHFSGIVVEAERGNEGHHRTSYRVTLLPSLYRLDNGSDCRIFQSQSVPDIVKTVLDEHGITNVTWQIGEDHAVREYLACYNETHLAFVERILAEEGIFYFFRHGMKGQVELVLTDQPFDIPVCDGQPLLDYNAMASGVDKTPYCFALNQRQLLRATQFSQRDYTFHNPHAGLAQTGAAAPRGEKSDYELYRYPGRYKKDAVGSGITQQRIEAVRVDTNVISAQANTPLLLPGHQFALTGHPDSALNSKWRVLTIRHEGTQPQSWKEDATVSTERRPVIAPPAIPGSDMSGSAFGIMRSRSAGLLETRFKHGLDLAAFDRQDAQSATTYACAFTALDYTQAYRPPQSRKPLVDGPQIAIVVGPQGEQIFTDNYGRVKVHFPWDRHKDPQAEDSSCWIRVSQGWAGSSFGAIAIPRIGQEVIVDFLEGDPDQPVIMGRAYHANNHTPYQLPDHKTKMAVRSDTHKGDGGFNELSFEDEKGRENILFHAEKDQTIKIKNNQSQRIDANSLQAVGANKAVEIGNNLHEQVGGGMNVVVGEIGSDAKIGMFPTKMGELTKKAGELLLRGADIAGAGGAHVTASGEVVDGVYTLAQHVASGGALVNIFSQAQDFDKNRTGMNTVARHTYRATGGFDQALAGHGLAKITQDLAEDGTMQHFVKNNMVTMVGIGSTHIVGSTQVDVIGNNQHQFIGYNRWVDIHNDDFLAVGGAKRIGVSQEYTMASAKEIEIKVLTNEPDRIDISSSPSEAVTITLKKSGELFIRARDNINIISGKKIVMQAEEIHLNPGENVPPPPAISASGSQGGTLAGAPESNSNKKGWIKDYPLNEYFTLDVLTAQGDADASFKADLTGISAQASAEGEASIASLKGKRDFENGSVNGAVTVGGIEGEAEGQASFNHDGVQLGAKIGAGVFAAKGEATGGLRYPISENWEAYGTCTATGYLGGVAGQASAGVEATRNKVAGKFKVAAAAGAGGGIGCSGGFRRIGSQ